MAQSVQWVFLACLFSWGCSSDDGGDASMAAGLATAGMTGKVARQNRDRGWRERAPDSQLQGQPLDGPLQVQPEINRWPPLYQSGHDIETWAVSMVEES